jgi:hypothetical protein
MTQWVEDSAVAIEFTERFRTYGISVRGSDGTVQQIRHCPWCGARLPDELRDRWFEELEQLGIEDPTRENAPAEFLTSEWYIRRGL